VLSLRLILSLVVAIGLHGLLHGLLHLHWLLHLHRLLHGLLHRLLHRHLHRLLHRLLVELLLLCNRLSILNLLDKCCWLLGIRNVVRLFLLVLLLLVTVAAVIVLFLVCGQAEERPAAAEALDAEKQGLDDSEGSQKLPVLLVGPLIVPSFIFIVLVW